MHSLCREMMSIPYHFLVLLFFLSLSFFNFKLTAQVTTERINGKWVLSVAGKPFHTKGVTFGYDSDVNNYGQYFQDLNYLYN